MWFIGTGNFASLCLEELVKRNITFSRIITGNPTRSGRNGKENPSPTELKALSLGLNVTRTGKLTDNQELIRALDEEKPEIIFVIDFGQIIREPFLSRMCLNIHPSLLPEYRGAAPIQRALLDGKNITGVSVFRLVSAMDAGDILAQAEVEIAPEDNASDMYTRLADLGCDIASQALTSSQSVESFVECWGLSHQDESRATYAHKPEHSTSITTLNTRLIAQALAFTPQDDTRATYAPKIEKSEHEASFTMTAERFANTVRALDMSGGAYVSVEGKRLKLWRVRVRQDLKAENPGQVMGMAEGVIVSCCDCCIELLEVQAEGKKKTSGLEWSRGARLKAGDIV